jgi:catechol 2,3-dioxygenase-like lactoylglutathione lyase family enzyme
LLNALAIIMQTTPSDQSLTTPTSLSPVLQVKQGVEEVRVDNLNRIAQDTSFSLMDEKKMISVATIDPISSIPSGSAIARPPTRNRSPSGTLFTKRRPELRLTLSSEEKADFSAAIQRARGNLVSDATKLPKSTNMGLGNDAQPGAPSKSNITTRADTQTNAPATRADAQRALAKPSEQVSNPWPIPQPISDKERTHAPTANQMSINTHNSEAHSWEESETFDRPEVKAKRSPDIQPSRAVFLRAIPCMYVADVKNATSFYKDILGFSILGKPDSSHASLVRSPSHMANSTTLGRYRGTLKKAPADSVQVYLRIVPMGENGERIKPPPTTLWIMVNDVDAVHTELQDQWSKFAPRTDEYFPMHSFGDAKILSKPQNKAWGNRELHVVDGDQNKIIFFRELY